MKRLLDLNQLCEVLAISKSRYHEIRKPGNKYYDPDLPKAVKVFDDNKLRFYSEDVEKYIMKKLGIAA